MKTSTLFLVIPVVFWGLSYIAIKYVLYELEPVEMISARFFLATITLYIIIRIKNLSVWNARNRGRLFVGAMLIFIHFWVMATGMKETSASNTAWILTTAPIFIAIIGWLYLKERFKAIQWLGLFIAVIGVLFLTANGSLANLSWIKSRGDLIVLGSCITWAVYTIATRGISTRMNPLVATFWMTAIAGIIFIPYTLYSTGYHKFMTLQTNTYIALVFLGIFCLAIAFWLWSEGLSRQTAAEVGIYLYIEPLITMIGAWIILGEPVTIWLIIGALFICLGVYISERFGKIKITEHDV